MENIPPTERTRLRRLPQRGSYERATIDSILDEGLVCHIGFAFEGQPYVIPTTYARVDDRLYVHGSAASRMLRTLSDGVPVCVTVTLLDGLVLARSAFHHSMNYRSVVVLGNAVEVTDADERMAALQAITNHVVPGRWSETRWPNAKELKATSVLRLSLEEASAKVRAGGPIDDEEDLALGYWAGVIPVHLVADEPIPDPQLDPAVAVPLAAARYQR